MLSEQARDNQRLTSTEQPGPRGHELGERSPAVRALGQLITALRAERALDLQQPFLPPLQRYDVLDPAGRD